MMLTLTLTKTQAVYRPSFIEGRGKRKKERGKRKEEKGKRIAGNTVILNSFQDLVNKTPIVIHDSCIKMLK